MKKLYFSVAVTMFAFGAFAEATVGGLVVRQQWPWNNKVTVDFVLSDPSGAPHDLKIVFKNGETVLDVPTTALVGDLEDVLPGARRIVWDPTGVSDNPLESLTATVTVADDPKKFMVLDLSGGSTVEQFPVSFVSHPPKAGWAADQANYTTKLVLRRINAGTYTVGSPETEGNRVELHEPLRQVALSKGYYLALFPTTNKQYEQIVGARPSGSITGDDAPVYMVSLAMLRGENAHLTPADGGTWPKSGEGSFFANFNARVALGEDLAGYQFDVPSGAQWEIACRAGTTTAWYNGLENDPDLPDFAARLGEIARYSGSRSSAVPTVTARRPNPWGFYDFIGNTREWLRDFFNVQGSITDYRNAVGGVDGVVRWTGNAGLGCSYTRGGYEWCAAHEVRTARWTYAGYATPTGTGNADRELGFRIACTYFGD